MLNPIDTDHVIRDGGAHGRVPDQVHAGVAWWIAACFVVTMRARRLVVAHDGRAASAEFFDLLLRGAVNARHYACQVLDLGRADEGSLLAAMHRIADAPGILVTTKEASNKTVHVTIALFGRDGRPVDEPGGLAAIRRMIAEDRVPIPVNKSSKGSVRPYPSTTGEDPDE
ncbi:hypothetical protein [Streptomyces tsukubensis]|uniref:hypothetical protein n=1 Tax=Streptomyces tsukubensis TaxID=83656 RepID=UPI00344B87A6